MNNGVSIYNFDVPMTESHYYIAISNAFSSL